MPALRILGVRHHSPACARLVQRVLSELKPRWVLIEGPADMNTRLPELALDHEPPIAIFSFHFDGDRRHSCWSPFCVHSPEWVALRQGLAQDAEVRFIDLPAWSVPDEPENRYADRRGPPTYLKRLEMATGESGYDAVWDACFEHPDEDDLEARLRTYFDGLRAVEPASESDLAREEFMKQHIAWALAQGGDVLVVCGGFHAPALASAAELEVEQAPTPPPPASDARAASWLVPYSQHRLDSFTGYASGLPSPAWYRWSWLDKDPGKLGLQSTARRLRARGLPVSAADTVAAWTQAQALARVRGRNTPARVDLLDAIASTWIKDALDAPLPWAERTVLPAGTHPVVVEMLRALSGEHRGRLARQTPLPPLVHHVRALLQDLDLSLPAQGSREVVLVPGEVETRAQLVALERLMLLDVTGIERTGHPDDSPQRLRLFESEQFDSTLLEAASYGPTLGAAAAALLEERAADAGGFLALVELLTAALRAGLPTLSRRAVDQLRHVTAREPVLGDLGEGLAHLVGLLRHGALHDSERAVLCDLIDAAVERLLWLLEGIRGGKTAQQGAATSLPRVRAVLALRDAILRVGEASTIPPERVEGVLRRLAFSSDAPAELRGAGLGALLSLSLCPTEEATRVAGEACSLAGAESLGEYLVGLLTLTRELLAEGGGLAAALDGTVQSLDATEFKVALPALRLAFQQLPVRERATFAALVAPEAQHLVRQRLTAPALDVAAARALEERVDALLVQYGLVAQPPEGEA